MTAENSNGKSSVLLDALHVHPEDAKNPDSIHSPVSSYVEHESEILNINEYYARCDPKKNYASMWFKITDSDPKFSRLYVVINKGKINTLSKELDSLSGKIDSGKVYVKLN